MLSGIYSSVSAFNNNENKLSIINNNIANANTPGFREAFMLVKAQENENAKDLDRAISRGINTSYATESLGIYKNHLTAGEIKSTDNPLDVAISPKMANAFFRVKMDQNSSQFFYTRNGQMSIKPIDSNNPNSPFVLYAGDNILMNNQGMPIEIDPTQGELSISPEGKIFQGDFEVNQIPLYRMNSTSNKMHQKDADLFKLESLGNSLYRIPEEFQDDIFPLVIDGKIDMISQGKLEGSNVNTIKSMAQLVEVSKYTSALKDTMKIQFDNMGKFFQLIKN